MLAGKAIYYLIKRDNYLKVSTLLILICSIFAVYLNIEGTSCIREINSLALQQDRFAEDNIISDENQRNNSGFSRLDQQQLEQDRQARDTMLQQSYELRKHCFLVTNLYVYSLFGIIIGFILLVIWYTRYKQIWSWRKRNGREEDDDNQRGLR